MSPGKATCEDCRVKSASRRRELATTDICQVCAKAPICFDRSRSRCLGCLDSQLARTNKSNHRRRSAGHCVRCNAASRVDNSYCERCWFRDREKKLDLQPGDLNALWSKQGGKCALSGAALVPGPNASVDHRVAVCRGGSLGIENLQWVSLQVNYCKRDMSNEDFIALCRSVATRYGE